ncbi:glucosamine kinase [Mycolicibacterium sediminis]|uniref:glucosamine kinase n=1 Tax=Mycolicibacterium sediminis TaxID=1286180 RepID=UPI0013CFB9E5|nr:glucosamine kinase [Mycolicibacterium sediminis]
MPEPVDSLDLGDGRRLAVTSDGGRLAALPMVRSADGTWRRARPGDGAAEALLGVLAAGTGVTSVGDFTVRSWANRDASGERGVGVDQTNESVIVGDAAVVKWATHLQEGPHPAITRLTTLRDAGFAGIPAPWGLVTWHAPDAAETVVASVDRYLPGAVDGWTWAVELITEAALAGDPAAVAPTAIAVGTLIADLHAALAITATTASAADAARWRDDAMQVLDAACIEHDVARANRGDIGAVLDDLGGLDGTPIIEAHGDLHVGQVLRGADGSFAVTDFDGNPVLPASQRALPVPAVLDVAGMAQSFTHAAIVADRYTALDPAALADAEAAARDGFVDAYRSRLGALGQDRLYDPRTLRAFRLQQVLREIVYAARHLPRWMYVPDAALPRLMGRHP